uniref:Ig-like domain-containing protein n=1 Tax=Tetraodon nigroviridis TaxID=99883 RepID=H3CCK8_TETNG
MVDFKWIQTSLSLILMFQHSEADRKHLVSRGETTLICENLIQNQQRCINTVWWFSNDSRSTVELVRLGQIRSHKPGRLSLSENCSLTIKNLTGEDAGLYTCRQFDSLNRQTGEDAALDLSVVTIKEQKNGDKVTLSCSVFTHGPCSLTVKWFNDEEELEGSREHQCGAAVELDISGPTFTSSLNFLKCEVEERQPGSVHLFPFRPPSPEEPASTTDPATSPGGTTATASALDLKWLFFIIPAVLVVLVIVFLAVFRSKRRKGGETFRKENMDQPDQDICYTSISFSQKSQTGAQISAREDDENVTYSAVKNSPSSNSDNPNQLYTTATYSNV